MLISYFILLLMVLVGIGFFTLLERKLLSYIQLRKGPNKVGVAGLLQPFADGLKLFLKGMNMPSYGNVVIFLLGPMLGLVFCLIGWSLYVMLLDLYDYELGILFFVCLSGSMVYVLIISGWSSGSMYSMLGSYRGVAQSISYEVVMAFILLSLVISVSSYSFMSFYNMKVMLLGLNLPVGLIWLSVVLAETNRSPYDFAEGESELVSGYNVEYSSVGFSLLFMAEYGNIMLMSYLTELMFFGWYGGFFMMLMMLLIVWVRGAYPRYRYDKLMGVVWKYYLFFMLSYFLFIFGVWFLSEMNIM